MTTGPTPAPGAPPQTAWQQPPLAVAPAAPRPATGPSRPSSRPPGRAPAPRRATSRPARRCGPVRHRARVLTATGDSAPWRRPEPAPRATPEATSLFFAAPLPPRRPDDEERPAADPGLDADERPRRAPSQRSRAGAHAGASGRTRGSASARSPGRSTSTTPATRRASPPRRSAPRAAAAGPSRLHHRSRAGCVRRPRTATRKRGPPQARFGLVLGGGRRAASAATSRWSSPSCSSPSSR